MPARVIPIVLRPDLVARLAGDAADLVRCGFADADAIEIACSGERLTANERAAIAIAVTAAPARA